MFLIAVEEDSPSACDWSPASPWTAEDSGGPEVPRWRGNEHEAAGQHRAGDREMLRGRVNLFRLEQPQGA